MEATAELKKSWGVIKAHWLLIAIIVFLVVGFALYYDLKPDKKGKTGRFTEF
jgi:hypothetical protein